MSEFAIEVRGLGKGTILDGVDLEVEPGSVHALLGPNGAGKTTLLRLVMGLLAPDRGTALVLGRDLRNSGAAHRARVAYVAQSAPLHGWMTLDEHARYFGRLYPAWDAGLLDRFATRLEIPRAEEVDSLSPAQREKAALALALAARPEVLLLDEPLAGADSLARRELLAELIDRLAAGPSIAILLATANVGGLERLADHAAILDRGRIVVRGRVDDLLETWVRVQAVFPGDAPPPGFEVAGARWTRVEGPVLTATVDRRRLEAIPGARVQIFPLGLEDLYLEVVGEGRP